MSLHMKRVRLQRLPDDLRQQLKAERRKRGWTQAELGRQIGLPQMHISGIENGKIVPRYDTLLDLVRVLGQDLVLLPRELVPVVHALIRDYRQPESQEAGGDDRPLYATGENQHPDH